MTKPKIISFFLPQFHENSINNKNWGAGFTEWTNVSKARANFKTHYQPHIPQALGFYDLANTATLRRQTDLATRYGIDAFCFYHYWFDGVRALEKPMDLFIQSEINFPFCICWANENWTRNWDGGNQEIILQQTYLKGFEFNFVKSIKYILTDPRYLKVNNKPLLLIYRPTQFPNPDLSLTLIRKAAKELRIGELALAIVDAFDLDLVSAARWSGTDGVDFIIEFPPHGYFTKETLLSKSNSPLIRNRNFKGRLFDYQKIIRRSMNKALPNEINSKYIRGIIPNWDNTPRRQNTASICCRATPTSYYYWLKYLISESALHNRKLLFINAWNEWGEGAHLEPDLLNGLEILDKTRLAINSSKDYHKDKTALIKFLNESSEQDIKKTEKKIAESFFHTSFLDIVRFALSRIIKPEFRKF